MEHPSLIKCWLKTFKKEAEDTTKVYLAKDTEALLVEHGAEGVFIKSEGVLTSLR